jgi:hypothetical protein
MALQGKSPVRYRIVIHNQTIQKINFNYLGCALSYNHDKELQNKLFKFPQICETIKQILANNLKGCTIKIL